MSKEKKSGFGKFFKGFVSKTSSDNSDKVKEIIAKHGGTVMFWASWVLMVIFEAFWRPYKHLSDVDNDDIEKLVEESKKDD